MKEKVVRRLCAGCAQAQIRIIIDKRAEAKFVPMARKYNLVSTQKRLRKAQDKKYLLLTIHVMAN